MPIQRRLEGICVLEIAAIIVGPLCGQYLGDMGAEVIKLEPPEGDRTRVMGPRRSPQMGSFFMTSNRNKRSIVVDLKTPEGIAILQKLLASCDVLVHSMRTSAANRLGLNYDSLKPAHPQLIYCHVAGFGDDGTYAGRAAYDDIIQAASGLAQLQTVIAGQPRFMPTILADKLTGLQAAYSVAMEVCSAASTTSRHRPMPTPDSVAARALPCTRIATGMSASSSRFQSSLTLPRRSVWNRCGWLWLGSCRIPLSPV